MTWILLVGDLTVMGFLAVVGIWVCAPSNRRKMDEASRIPLDDEDARDG